MTNRTTTLAISVALLTVVTGCGGDGGGGLTLEEFGERSPTVTCSVIRDCYGEDLLELFAANCETEFGARFEEGQLPRLQAAIDAGRIVYDGARAQACLDAIEAAGCDAVDRPAFPDCEGLLTGTVESGGACSIQEECEGDSFCQVAAGSCGGSCQARVASGSACEADDECQSGLKCFDGVCRTPAGEGAACQGSDGVECAGGMVCIGAMAGMAGGEPTPGECQTVATALSGALGETCNLQGGPFCQPGLSCALIGVEGTTPVFECVGASSSGGTCNLGFPDPCPSAEACDAQPFMAGGSFEGSCQPLPAAGEPCDEGRCAPGSTCDGTTCRATQHIGGACSADGECYSGSCDGTTCVEGMLCE